MNFVSKWMNFVFKLMNTLQDFFGEKLPAIPVRGLRNDDFLIEQC